MKTMDNTKKVVLAIGSIALISGIVGLINSNGLMEEFFTLYTGFTLIGSTLLHKEENAMAS